MCTEHPKKMLILNILKILHKYTDEGHRLSQKEIIDKLEKEYNMKVDRKTVKRNIIDLIEYGDRDDGNEIMYDTTMREVLNHKTGEKEIIDILSNFYIIRDFTDGELHLLIESLLFSKHIPYNQREELIGKLEGLSSKYFNSRINHIRTMSMDSPKNNDLFYNIEILDEAISNFKQVSFNYNRYGVDKKLKLQLEAQLNDDGRPREYIINPYQIAATNGRYYLICNHDMYDNVSHYRLDRITNISLLDKPRKLIGKVKGLEDGLDLPKHMSEHIYMFTGESQEVTLRFKKYFIDEIIDWFGTSIVFFDETDEEVSARVRVNLIAMRKWALQYALHARVVRPKRLVDEIRNDIKKAGENYK